MDDRFPDLAALRRQLDALWKKHLSRLAFEDPTLEWLAQALAEERAIMQMDMPALLAFLNDMAARGGPQP